MNYSFRGFFLIFLVACSFNAFPVSDDVQLGRQVKQEIESNPNEYPILNNPAAEKYLQDMINQILQSPEVKYRKTFAYDVKIINDDRTVNAFCTPGGYIYVYTGLLKKLDNEATLAGVLGHEIAHAENRHSTQRLTKAYGASILTGIVLGDNPSQLEQIGANLFTGLALLKNSRSDELESDEDSFKYLKSTKWYPGAIKFFFDEINQGGSSGVKEWFSTHPMPENRIKEINEMLKKNNINPPSESNLFKQRYQNFLRQLR